MKKLLFLIAMVWSLSGISQVDPHDIEVFDGEPSGHVYFLVFDTTGSTKAQTNFRFRYDSLISYLNAAADWAGTATSDLDMNEYDIYSLGSGGISGFDTLHIYGIFEGGGIILVHDTIEFQKPLRGVPEINNVAIEDYLTYDETFNLVDLNNLRIHGDNETITAINENLILQATSTGYEVTVNDSLTVNGDITVSGAVSLTGAQNVDLSVSTNDLLVQGGTAGTEFIMEVAAQDNDGTDDVALEIDAVGLQGGANREDLWMGWDVGNTQFEIRTESQGTGAARDLSFHTPGNSNQLFIDTDGEIYKNNAGTVADSAIATRGYVDASGGGGNVTKVGTPVNNQIAVWTGDGTIDGDANFTWSSTVFNVTGDQDILGSLDVDNLNLNGNTLSSTNAGGDVIIDPNGTGNIYIGNYEMDADQTVGAGQDNYVLTYDNGTGVVNLENPSTNGTWTPALEGGTSNPTVTYTTQAGYYELVGDIVTAHVNISTSAFSGGSGALQITLPFAVNSDSNYISTGALTYFGITISSNPSVQASSGNAFANIQNNGSGGSVGINISDVSGNPTVRFSLTYRK